MVIGFLRLIDASQRYLPCCQPASEVAENLGRFLVSLWSVLARGNDFELI